MQSKTFFFISVRLNISILSIIRFHLLLNYCCVNYCFYNFEHYCLRPYIKAKIILLPVNLDFFQKKKPKTIRFRLFKVGISDYGSALMMFINSVSVASAVSLKSKVIISSATIVTAFTAYLHTPLSSVAKIT